MFNHQTRGFASPSRYVQGRYELEKLKEYAGEITTERIEEFTKIVDKK